MKKFLKILGITFGVLVLIVFIGFIFVLRALPSPAKIGEYIRPSSVKSALKEAHQKEKATLPMAATTPADSPTPYTAAAEKQAEEDKALVADLVDEKKPLSDVCGSLKNASKSKMDGYTFKEFGEKYKDSVLGADDDKDPLIQSMKPTLRYLFAEPSMKELLRDAEDAAARGETEGLMDKAGFYSKAYSAYREMSDNKENIQNVMDRSYHLMILSKVIAKRPDLAEDPHVTGFCSNIEAALNSNSPVSFQEERNEFNRFILYSGVDPHDVGFDPNYHTQIELHMTKQGVKITGGWMDSLLKPSAEEVKTLEEQAPK